MEERKKLREKLSKRSAQLAHKRMQIIAQLEKEEDGVRDMDESSNIIDMSK